MNKEEILKKLEEEDIKMVRFLYIDNEGLIRGYMAKRQEMKSDLESGHSITVAMPFFTAFDLLVPDSKFGAVGEFRIVPDMDTFKILPYAEKNAALICDIKSPDLKPLNICARTKLKEILNKVDYEVFASIENELYFVLKKENGEIVPFEDSLCFSTKGMNINNKIVLEIVDALEKQGIELEKYYPEYGPGQQEFVLKYRPALQAADNQIYFRETVRAITQKYGIIASFMPKPFNDKAGSGAHINLSCWKNGKNLFYDKNDQFGLSKFAYNFIAGVLKHIRALCAFTTPTITSYKRLLPGHWSSAFGCYGYDNREAAIRIPSTQFGNWEKTARIEYKPADCSSNPYLAIAAIIAAGNDGVVNGFDPGPAIMSDPGLLSEEERQKRGIQRLPQTLAEALDALDKDEYMREFFSNEMVDEYIKMKKNDWFEFMHFVTDWEVKKYLDIF
ncbi:MAG: glutamine synthetase [Thermosediminibacterales bacterium]|nr:glutamine synthetase [Thermosediminibacterales bacterium]